MDEEARNDTVRCSRESLLQQTSDAIVASEERCDAAETSVAWTVEIVRFSRATIVTSMDLVARIGRRRGIPHKS